MTQKFSSHLLTDQGALALIKIMPTPKNVSQKALAKMKFLTIKFLNKFNDLIVISPIRINNNSKSREWSRRKIPIKAETHL